MLEQVRNTIASHGLLAAGDRVLVALSGGADSVALLHLLVRLAPEFKLSLHALHISHGIRPHASEREASFCRDLCHRLGVPLTVVSENVPSLARKLKKGLEETARDFRYGVFDSTAQELRCNRIALGHHADDQAETILFRVLRGTGRPGLQGIPAKRGKYIRPMIDVSKSEILEYLQKEGLEFCVDESNEDVSYSRNYIRHRLLEEIRRKVNPSVSTALRNLAESITEEEHFLEAVVDESIARAVTMTLGGKLSLDLKRLSAYAPWVRRRVLRRCLMGLSKNGTAPDKQVVVRLERLCERREGSSSLSENLQSTVSGDRLYLFRKAKNRFRVRLEFGKAVIVDGLFAELKCTLGHRPEAAGARRQRARTVYFDAAKVEPPLEVRSVQPGDRFRPLGMKGTKKVGDYLTDRKVPAVVRDENSVVCDRNGIIWLTGLEISETVKIDKSTRKVIKLAYRERKAGRADALRAVVGPKEDR